MTLFFGSGASDTHATDSYFADPTLLVAPGFGLLFFGNIWFSVRETFLPVYFRVLLKFRSVAIFPV
ncbi:hypothetical protein ACU19_06395 [Actinobaculum suis]|nr:hypothetical protein ACU19_06395 [Actinobaculum suis]